MSEVTFQALWTVYSTALVKGDIDAKVELGNQQDLLLTESNEDNIKIDEKQEDEDNENNEEEQ